MENATPDEFIKARDGVREEYLACLFILNSDKQRYGKMLEDIENSYTMQHDNYPKPVHSAYIMMTNFKFNQTNHTAPAVTTNESVAFVTKTEETERPAPDYKKVRCWRCGKEGHAKWQCPEKPEQKETVEEETKKQSTKPAIVNVSNAAPDSESDSDSDGDFAFITTTSTGVCATNSSEELINK